MAKANLVEVYGIHTYPYINSSRIKYLISVSGSIVHVLVQVVAPDLGHEFGTYVAFYKIIAKSVEVPDSWAPYKIIKKEVKKLFE